MRISIQTFGAVGDGKTLNTAAIQKAIDTCSAAGGGSVVVEDGTYMTGTIVLKQNVDLHLEANGRLLGSPSFDDYPDWDKKHVKTDHLPRFRGGALIFAEEVSNISITGKGTIDANGDVFIEKVPDGEQCWMPYRRIDGPTPPRVVFFTGCQNVLVEDITMINQPAGWSFWVHDCDYVAFDRCKILANVNYPNNDGIHINSSRNVTVSNCDISCGDDCLIIRANNFSLAENKICEKVVVTNCNLTSHSAGIRIGWCNDGTIRNCAFTNLVMTDTTVGIYCFFPSTQGSKTVCDVGREASHVENLTFSNIIMDRIYDCPIIFFVAEDEDLHVEVLRNVYFDGVHASSLRFPYFCGREDCYVENVRLTNCSFTLLPESEDDHEVHGGVLFSHEDAENGERPSMTMRYVKNLVMNQTEFSVL